MLANEAMAFTDGDGGIFDKSESPRFDSLGPKQIALDENVETSEMPRPVGVPVKLPINPAPMKFQSSEPVGVVQRSVTGERGNAVRVSASSTGFSTMVAQVASEMGNVSDAGSRQTVSPRSLSIRDARKLGTQILRPAPVAIDRRTASNGRSATAVAGSATPISHAGTQTGVTRIFAPGVNSPLRTGDPRQIGRSTVQSNSPAPPQSLIPSMMRKLFSSRDSRGGGSRGGIR